MGAVSKSCAVNDCEEPRCTNYSMFCEAHHPANCRDVVQCGLFTGTPAAHDANNRRVREYLGERIRRGLKEFKMSKEVEDMLKPRREP